MHQLSWRRFMIVKTSLFEQMLPVARDYASIIGVRASKMYPLVQVAAGVNTFKLEDMNPSNAKFIQDNLSGFLSFFNKQV